MNRQDTHSRNVERKKLFTGICLALLPTAFSFILVSNILHQLKTEFILTNADVGYIGGAALWGMAVSLLTIGPFLEKIGLKNATIGAFIGHLSGVTLFLIGYLFAGDPSAFWILFMGAIGMGFGNGMIEVAGNPLTAALYPDNKTTKLNHFHGYYMGGLVLGGLIGWGMSQIGTVGPINIGHWTWQMAVVYIPILLYGAMLFPREFPQTETAQAGIPTREMFRYTFTTPGVWGLILLMMFTLSMEMGPMRWIPDVLQAAGLHGMLVLVWISGLMFLLRMLAGQFVEKLSPTGMLLGGSFVTFISLMMFSFIETGTVALMIAGALFAIGIAFFVPNMIGLMSERFPKAGSLGIVLLIGMGFFAAGGSNAIMGEIADSYLPDALDEEQAVAVLEQVENRFPEYIEKAEDAADNPEELARLGYREADVRNILSQASEALNYYQANGEFEGNTTGNPYILEMGDVATGTRRLNLAQSFNPIGSISGVIISKFYILSHLDVADASERAGMSAEQLSSIQQAELNAVMGPYVTIGFALLALWIVIAVTKMPTSSTESTTINLWPTIKRLAKKKNYAMGVIAQFFM